MPEAKSTCPYTEAESEEQKLAAWRARAVQEIFMTNWRRMPDDVLRQVLNLIAGG